DQFFRNPSDTAALNTVPGRLAQMRGVLSVLGLDQASLAVVRMRDTVERLLTNEIADSNRPGVFEKLGNSFGALGFLIDMLSYQRSMARKLFVYDEELGELRIVMGKARARAADTLEDTPVKLEARSDIVMPEVLPRTPVQEPTSEPTDFAPLFDFGLDSAPESALVSENLTLDAGIEFNEPMTEVAQPFLLSEVPELLESSEAFELSELPAVPVTAPQLLAHSSSAIFSDASDASDASIDDELLGVFLEEASEVVASGLAATDVLRGDPGNLSEQTILRRAFHTLKGSSRMVGLNQFGDAGWAMEQVINLWLAEQKPMQPDLLSLSSQALQAFGQWTNDLAEGNASAWSSAPFVKSAEAMKLDGTLVPLTAHGVSDAPSLLPDAIQATEAAAVIAGAADTQWPTAAQDNVLVSELPDSQGDVGALEFPANVLSSSVADEVDMSVFEAALNDTTNDPTNDTPTALEIESFNEDFVADAALVEASPEIAQAPAELTDESLLDDVEAPADLATDLADSPLVEMPSDESTQWVDLGGDASIVATEDLEAFNAVEPEKWLDDESTFADARAAAPRLDSETPVSVSLMQPQDGMADDEAVRIIGSLRIGIPLYNVYLNEADEWSRRLVTCLQEWSLELHEPLPDTAVALSHSMAGSSATVGFSALSNLSRALEHALEHVQLRSDGTPEQAQIFLAAAEDIRRLLHQFAAGFLKDANQEVLDQLRLILEEEVDNASSSSNEDLARWDDEPAAESAAPVTEPQADYAETEAELEAPAVTTGYVAPALSSVGYDREGGDESVSEAAAVAHRVAHHSEEDIDAVDVIDPDLFPIFEEEAAELLPQLGKALRQWAARPDNAGARNEALRALHTLKGSARLAGAMRLGELAHRLESAIEQLGSEAVTAYQIDSLQGRFDALQMNFSALRTLGQNAPEAMIALPAGSAVDFAGRGSDVPHAAAPAGAANPGTDLFAAAAASMAPAAQVVSNDSGARAIRRPVQTQLAPLNVATNQSVRVRSQLLDRLVNQAGEVLISRSRLDARVGQVRTSLNDLTVNLDRLRQHLRDIEVQSESQMQSRLALTKDSTAGFDPLEFDRFTRVQELTRMMAESVNDVATVQRNLQRAMEGAEDDLISQGRQARELQRDLLRTRMVEFEGISERLYAVVRQASKETGKQIKLDITGGSIEMDRGVLDRMTPAFEHLLRNCVAHGIEEPQVRMALGKSASGTITVDLHQEGNDVSVEFRDDGAGLNVARIREKAVLQGIVSPDTELSDTEAAALIFTPGFTTASEVT
ncbi:MAG: Hpt domain-containing protein, partial [Burkholderiaceae bacterium]|nr:Hpt domain-containing protein [Burkholderiaceae bacterium]